MQPTARDHPERLDAMRLLREHGVAVAEVVAVDVDSILYVTPDGEARTAWVRYASGPMVVLDVPGFPAEP